MAGFTQADIDNMKRAMASGVKSVSFSNGKSVTYIDIAAMQRALTIMETEVNGASMPRHSLVSISRD